MIGTATYPDGGSGSDGGNALCGNSVCDPTENAESCCKDCGCPSGYACDSMTCIKTGGSCGNTKCELGESSATCCTDCGCPAGYSCGVGGCRLKPDVCGDGSCGATENSTNCCRDCGCPSGYACDGAVCKIPGISTLSWKVEDFHYGEQIGYRFYDQTRGLVWPSSTTVYLISGGGSYIHDLRCNTGDKICFGGRGYITGNYWGVDYDGTKACTGCCRTCADVSTTITITD